MKLLAAVIVLVAPAIGGSAIHADAAQQFCVPPPVRTTPRHNYERADKWQRDQRTIA